MTLYSVELSTLAKDNYRFQTRKIVYILLFVYVGMTAMATVMLRIAGMDWFDAVNHAFSGHLHRRVQYQKCEHRLFRQPVD